MESFQDLIDSITSPFQAIKETIVPVVESLEQTNSIIDDLNYSHINSLAEVVYSNEEINKIYSALIPRDFKNLYLVREKVEELKTLDFRLEAINEVQNSIQFYTLNNDDAVNDFFENTFPRLDFLYRKLLSAFDKCPFKERTKKYLFYLHDRYWETKDCKYILRINEILSQEKSLLNNKIKELKKSIRRFTASLYYNDSNHKLALRLIARKLFKIPSHDDEDNLNVSTAFKLLIIKPSYYGRKISIN